MTIAWPQKDAELFTNKGGYYEFSHFSWGGVKSQFYGYVEGYKHAADTIVRNALENKNIKELDTCIFPVCFLYRQYLELAMKNIFLTFSTKSLEEKKQTINRVGHDLKKIWEEISPMLKKGRSSDEKELVSVVGAYILQFHNVDSSSFSFRYPITKGLEAIHTEEKRINIKNLMERMDEVYNFFDAVTMQLDHEKEIMMEMSIYFGE